MPHPSKVLPDLSQEEFTEGLASVSPEPLAEQAAAALWTHYRLLREWSGGLSLIGPGTAGAVLERHYGESLAALPLIGRGAGTLADIGSGAGFPGLVLAAARPRMAVHLVESRQRKWAFLRTAIAAASLPCQCLNARVAPSLPPELPEELDFVTLRAVKLPPATLAALLGRLGPAGALLLWRGGATPELPPGCQVARTVPLPGSLRRRIVEVRKRP